MTRYEYNAQAKNFLAKHGLRLTIREGNALCPLWGHEKGCAHGDHYRITITRKADRKRIAFDWWGSIHMMQTGERPREYDILSSVSSEATMPLDPDEVMQEIGPMPIKQALASCRLAKRLQGFFSEDELTALSEIQ